MLFKIILLVFFCAQRCFSARILGIVSTPSYSHQVVFQQLWKELSLKGHQVTVLTTDPIKDDSLTNLTEIDMHDAYEEIETHEKYAVGPFTFVGMVADFFYRIVKKEMQLPQVQELIQNETEHFDVVLVEGHEMVMTYFSERFKCPYIQIFSLEAWARQFRAMGNPTNPGIYPDFSLPYSKGLNFWKRLESFLFEIYSQLYERWINNYKMEKLVKKYFGLGYPSIEEVKCKVSLLFINTDSVLHEVRPLLPNIVQIGGGTHLTSPKPLPSNLQQQLDSAKNGFIYISFGSNVKSKNLAPKNIKKLMHVFSQLPYLVLWKFELDELPGKPSNVIISKWLPQQDILRHPNIRLFITQGGLQSTEEAIYAGVPMLGIPFIADQFKNVLNMQLRGLGLVLDIKTLKKKVLKKTIKELIDNPSYKIAVVKLAALGRDQPMTGLEKAVWWTEYVIRNKGAEHLRSPALDLSWYQYFLLDVGVFIITMLVVVVIIVKKVVSIVLSITKRCVCGSSKLKTN